MSSSQDTALIIKLLQQLECHFTWDLRKQDTDLTYLLKGLEEQIELDLGKEAGVARTYSYLGFVKFLLGSNDEALSNLQKSVELTKESQRPEWEKLLVVPYGSLAWLHYHMHNYDECQKYLKELQEIKEKHPPTAPSVPYADVLGEKGWTFLKFSPKYYGRAKECFNHALQLAPEEGDWNAGLAIVLYRTETELTSVTKSPAVRQLEEAIKKNPDDGVLKVYLGLKLLEYNKHREAESQIETALERSPEHPHVMQYVAKFFRMQGSMERSIALLQRALEKVQHSAFIHHQLALCYKSQMVSLPVEQRMGAEIQQARDQCICHLDKATTLEPSFIVAMTDLAVQYGYNKNSLKAEEKFQAAFQTARQKNENLQLVHRRYAEFQQYGMRCEPQAIQHYSACIKINSKSFEGMKGAKGLKHIAERRIDKNPNDGEAYGIMGFILKEQGDIKLAIEYYEKALSFMDNEDYRSDLCELRLSLQ